MIKFNGSEKNIKKIVYDNGTEIDCSVLAKNIELHIIDDEEFELFKILISEKYNELKNKREKNKKSICEEKFKYIKILYIKYAIESDI
ncbi:MAG: hypothetical protein ABF289_18295 [Clostridiales bacterium]